MYIIILIIIVFITIKYEFNDNENKQENWMKDPNLTPLNQFDEDNSMIMSIYVGQGS